MTCCGSSFWTASLSLSTSSSSFCLQRVPKSCWRVLCAGSCAVEDESCCGAGDDIDGGERQHKEDDKDVSGDEEQIIVKR